MFSSFIFELVPLFMQLSTNRFINFEVLKTYVTNAVGAFMEQMVFVWALGLIGSGQSSVMAGGYAGQFVMDGFLNLKVSKWKVGGVVTL